MSFANFGWGALDKLVGNLSDTYGTGDTLREKKRQESRDDYLFNERMGIQARVEGAKAAGLHPLAALGFQAGASPVQVIGADPIPSKNYQSLPPQRDVPENPDIARFNKARADREETEAKRSAYELENDIMGTRASRHALASQPGNPPQLAGPTSPANLSGVGTVKRGVVIKPDEVTAGTGGLTAGRHPGASEVDVPGYGKMTVPSGKLKEALEDNEIASTAMLGALNRDRWWKYLSSDVPWALGLRGPMDTFKSRSPSKRMPKSRLRYDPPTRRSGGATGSW